MDTEPNIDAKAASVAVETREPVPAIGQPRTVLAFPEPRRARERRIRRERQKPHRLRLETKIMAALEKLEDLRQEFIARLDALHGDPDLEAGCDDDVNIAAARIAGACWTTWRSTTPTGNRAARTKAGTATVSPRATIRAVCG